MRNANISLLLFKNRLILKIGLLALVCWHWAVHWQKCKSATKLKCKSTGLCTDKSTKVQKHKSTKAQKHWAVHWQKCKCAKAQKCKSTGQCSAAKVESAKHFIPVSRNSAFYETKWPITSISSVCVLPLTSISFVWVANNFHQFAPSTLSWSWKPTEDAILYDASMLVWMIPHLIHPIQKGVKFLPSPPFRRICWTKLRDKRTLVAPAMGQPI